MHALETIHKLNYETYGRGIEDARRAGKHVVAKSTGLHVVSFETFDDGDAAIAHAQAQRFAEGYSPDQTFTIFLPR